MSAVHDLCRKRLVDLQAAWLALCPQAGRGHATAAAALPLMSREQLTEAILAARENGAGR